LKTTSDSEKIEEIWSRVQDALAIIDARDDTQDARLAALELRLGYLENRTTQLELELQHVKRAKAL
jgi:hypothetical protein